MSANPNYRSSSAFSLVELLVVIGIIAILSAALGPAISSLSSAGSVNKAVADLERTLDLARLYALTHQTFVRVAIADVPGATEASTIVLVIAPSDGTLDAESKADMEDPAKWPALNRPLILKNFQINDALNATDPGTSTDALPSASDVASFSRKVPGVTASDFAACIQFNPSGQASVNKGVPARYVKIGVDKRDAQAGKNPFIIRMVGSTGAIRVLRKEDGVK